MRGSHSGTAGKWLCLLGLCLGLACGSGGGSTRAAAAAPTPTPTPAPPLSPVARALTDSALWGKHFASALASLPAWSLAGEPTVVIFPNRIVGGTPHGAEKEARESASRVMSALATAKPPVRPAFAALLLKALEGGPPMRLEPMRFWDDQSFRAVWAGSSLQFFSPDLKLTAVAERLGPPEKMEREVIEGDAERRPLILTVSEYFGGAVRFAESDWAPRPGFVDRVLLKVPAVEAVVFKVAP
jgi:hypothetical protein